MRFQWELDVLFTNLFKLDPDAQVVCLYASTGPHAMQHYDHTVQKWGQKVEVHMYADNRDDKSYSATFRPYLWYCYLSEDPSREHEDYFQVESDIIFRKLPDYSKLRLGKNRWYASDCEGYIGYDYLKTRERGEYIIDNFASIIGVERSYIEKTPGVGAHWLMSKPTAEYWWDVYQNCNKLFHFIGPVESNIQKWTVEMWSQLYTAGKYGISWATHSELDFSMATDDVALWYMRNIYHNNGVIGHNAEFLFNKSAWVSEAPFGSNFDYVRKDKCSIKYVEALQEVDV